MGEIILVRGLPGSGKSTMAKKIVAAKKDFVHLETDMFFEKEGIYEYDSTKIKEAHDWCVSTAKRALEEGKSVVISNTFIKIWEMKRYIDFGFPFKIVEMKGNWTNIHDISQEKIEVMKIKWEMLPSDWINNQIGNEWVFTEKVE